MTLWQSARYLMRKIKIWNLPILLLMTFSATACQSAIIGTPTTTLAPTVTETLTSTARATSSPTPSPTREDTASSTLTETTEPSPTSTITPTATPAQREVISAENAHRLVQIGDAFDLGLYQGNIDEYVFRPEGPWLAVAYNRGDIGVFDFLSRERLATLDVEGNDINDMVASPDGKLLAAISAKAEKVIVWELDNFIKIHELPLEGYESGILFDTLLGGEFSEDNQLFAFWGCRIGGYMQCIISGVIVYDLEDGKIRQEIRGVQKRTDAVVFSDDYSTLVLLGSGENILDGDMFVWDLDQQTRVAAISLENGKRRGQYHPFADFFVTSLSKELLFFETESWNLVKTTSPGPDYWLNDWMISEASPILITESVLDSGREFSIRDANNEKIVYTIETPIIIKFVISPDGRYIFMTNLREHVLLWGIGNP